MKKVWFSAGLASLVGLTGCYGFNTSAPTDTVPFPQDYVLRSVLGITSATAAYDLCDNVGYVAEQVTPTKGGGNPTLIPLYPLRKTNTPEPKTTVVPSNSAVKYSDTVTRSVGANGTYAIFAANMSADQAASVSLRDVAFCKIPREDVPIQQLLAFTVPSNKAYVWVSGNILTTIDFAIGVKRNAGATLTGAGFGAGGNVYEARDNHSEIDLIGADVIDIARLKTLCTGSSNPCETGTPSPATGGPLTTTPVTPETSPPAPRSSGGA